MRVEKTSIEHDVQRRISRRLFVSSAALAYTCGAIARGSQIGSHTALHSMLAYVGSYSSPTGTENSGGNGQGIYVFAMDPRTGKLAPRHTFVDPTNPTWLMFNRSATRLYSANETATVQSVESGSSFESGSISALSVDPSTGRLTLLNRVSSQGAGPAHLSLHPSGRYVLVANYSGGNVAVIAVRPDGSLGQATDVQRGDGPAVSSHATSAPPGSFSISGHDRPHFHMIQSDPSGRFVFATDLGTDEIYVWKFNVESGTLSAHRPRSVPLLPGDGPRHFAFHASGRWLYSLQEEASTLVAFEYDDARGALVVKQTISTRPEGFVGTNFTSEIRISPDGDFLYAANRLHDSIAIFSISSTGALTFIGEEWTRGDYPRSFSIDPSGEFLFCCNQRSDAITTFRRHGRTGKLRFTGQYTPVGSPAIITFRQPW